MPRSTDIPGRRLAAVLLVFVPCFAVTVFVVGAAIGLERISQATFYFTFIPAFLVIFAAGTFENRWLWQKLGIFALPLQPFVPGPCTSGIAVGILTLGYLKYHGAYFLQ